MITEDYCSYEIAKMLKEKGFDIPIWTRYEDNNEVIFGDKYDWNNSPMGQTSAPTLQMTMKWLREVYYLHITVYPGVSEYGFVWTYSIVFAKKTGKGETHFYKISQITTPIVESKSYEQACESAIKYCLENLI